MSSQFEDLEFVQGTPVASAAGAVMVVDLFASHVSKCLVTCPLLSQLQDRFPRVLFVGVTQEGPVQARSYVKEMGDKLRYRVACQSPGGTSLQRLVGVQKATALPVTFVIQNELLKWAGDPSDERLETLLEQLSEASGPKITRLKVTAAPKRDHQRSKSSGSGGNFFQRLATDLGMRDDSQDDTEDEELNSHVSDLNRRNAHARAAEEGALVGRASVRGVGGHVPGARPDVLQGSLFKKSRVGLVGWKERIFEQSGSWLYYFGYVGESRPRRRISLKTIKELSKRTHHEMGPCIGLLTPERFFLLAPGRKGSLETMRYWYQGLCAWQKWFEAHPDDEPDATRVFEEPKKGHTTMETITSSFAKGTKKLGKVVVAGGNLDDSSESSDEEDKRMKKEEREEKKRRDRERREERKEEEKRAREKPEPAVEEREPARAAPPPPQPREAEPWHHDIIPGQESFHQAEKSGVMHPSQRSAPSPPTTQAPSPPAQKRANSPPPTAAAIFPQQEPQSPRKQQAREPEPQSPRRHTREAEQAAVAATASRQQPREKEPEVVAVSPRKQSEPARYYDELQSEREEREKTAVVVQKADKRKEKEAVQRTVECRMTRSAELDLSMMGLTRLDVEWLAGMRGVRFIDVSFNVFDQFPEEALLQHTGNCQHLVMGGCGLPSIPPSIGQFRELKELTLNGNQMTTFPAEIGACQTLEQLSFANNQLRSIPESIGWLYRLEELHLSGNQLTSVPSSIGNMRKLQLLDLSCNKLRSVPDELVYCTQMMDLNLSQNEISALPERIGWLVRLASMNVSSNNLTDLPLSSGLLEGCVELGLGISINQNPIKDAEMVKQGNVGADRLINYLERRMMMGGFNQRAVMQGYPETWPYVRMQSVG